MKKLILPTLLVAATLLGACSPSQEAAPTPEAEPTATEAQEAPTQEATDAVDPGILVANEQNPCLPFSLIDLLLSTPYPGLPPVTSGDWVVGPEDATVTFMEYSDLQCPACAQFEPLMVAIQERYPNDVRIVFRHFPLTSIHDKALLGAQALEAAGEQGKFNEFKNFMFERQAKNPNNPAVADLPDEEFWAGVSPDLFDEWMAERVPELGINADQFLEDMFSEEIINLISEKKAQAESLGLRFTPTVFINGFVWPDQEIRSLENFSAYTDIILSQNREYESCPPTVIDEGKDYSAVITTTKGDIEVDLYANFAPYSVNSFVFLSREGWYDNLVLLVTDEVALSGFLSDRGFGGSGYIFLDELSQNINFNEVGLVGTFALGPGLNTSAFFISKIQLSEDLGRTVFGRVTAGLDVLDQLTLRENAAEGDLDRVLSITITEK